MYDLHLSWNDKYLDYEIETESKRTSGDAVGSDLETTSTSITRLKQALGMWTHTGICPWLETTSTSITRLKHKTASQNADNLNMSILKRQVPRLRDWNWNLVDQTHTVRVLETTSTSITRLKRGYRNNLWAVLIYRLETTSTSITRLKLNIEWSLELDRILETTSTSITRLKPVSLCVRLPIPFLKGSWNDKYLDYEIETCSWYDQTLKGRNTWNDKYLDYEIETLQ